MDAPNNPNNEPSAGHDQNAELEQVSTEPVVARTSSIIDMPRSPFEEDQLGVDKYLRGLRAFISNTQTPITIGIQGEWGSGKTSLMLNLREELCSGASPLYHPIWINTWQYSLLSKSTETMIKIITGVSTEISTLIKTRHGEKSASTVTQIKDGLMGFTRIVARVGASQVGIDPEQVDKAFNGKSEDSLTLLKLRESLQKAVEECLQLDRSKGLEVRGFLFFIDDLDRIDPPDAVQILELFKNIFDLPSCVFVLAIDYDVVVKGLKPKFGEMTAKNEREFRSFFDKIIQLPFSMPVGVYDVENFISNSLRDIGFLSESKFEDEEYISTLTEISIFSVGTNPRSLKRLMNTLSLITLVHKESEGVNYNEAVLYGLVALQTAYPKIYQLLAENPDFPEWGDDLANEKQLAPLSKEDDKLLAKQTAVIQGDSRNIFDDPWEKFLFKFCKTDDYLKASASSISKLLNLLKDIIEKELKQLEAEGKVKKQQKKKVGDAIEAVIRVSAVTSISGEGKSGNKGGRGGSIEVDIDEEPLEGKNLIELYEKFMVKAWEKGGMQKVLANWSPSNSRKKILISIDRIPTHEEGVLKARFKRKVVFEPDKPIENGPRKYTMEGQWSREQGLKVLQEFAEYLGFKFQVKKVTE